MSNTYNDFSITRGLEMNTLLAKRAVAAGDAIEAGRRATQATYYAGRLSELEPSTIARLETAASKLGALRPDLQGIVQGAMDAALDLRAGLPTGQEDELLSELEWTVEDLESATPAAGCFAPRQQPAEILCS